MWISPKNGVLATLAGITGLGIIFPISFMDCFKSQCNNQAYSIASIASLLLIALGLIVLLAGVIVQVKQDSSKWPRLVAVLVVVSLVIFSAYYFVFGGSAHFKARRFQATFRTPYFSATYTPPGYAEQNTVYFFDGSNPFSPGNMSSTTYARSLVDAKGGTYYKYYSLEQGDELNDAAGVLKYCNISFECDRINGKDVKDIYCQQLDRSLCAVNREGTYISVSSDVNGLSREDSVAILNSLVEK